LAERPSHPPRAVGGTPQRWHLATLTSQQRPGRKRPSREHLPGRIARRRARSSSTATEAQGGWALGLGGWRRAGACPRWGI